MKHKSSFSLVHLFCMFIISLILLSGAAFGDILIVPSLDYSTIQEAIDDSSNGDTIRVSEGTYTGTGNKNLDFGGKVITVESENGPEYSIIDCQGNGFGFYFHTGEGAGSVLLTVSK